MTRQTNSAYINDGHYLDNHGSVEITCLTCRENQLVENLHTFSTGTREEVAGSINLQ